MPQQPSVPAYSQPVNNVTNNLPQPTQSNFCLPEYKCAGNTLLYQNSYCATQVSQICASGCLNGACIAATSTATSTEDTNTNTNTNTGTATSAIDILDQISGYTATSSNIATATPLQLILDLTQDGTTGSIQSGQQVRSVSLLAPGSMQTSQLIGAQQTFTSSDLSGNVPRYTNPPAGASTFAILEDMKRVLLQALEYLRPFQISRNRAAQSGAVFAE